jgi:hypothetical protein
MTDSMRVFVNTSAVDLPIGADVGQAVRTYDPAIEDQIARGTAYITDARGIEIAPGAPLESGAIIRVVVRARRRSADADA